MMKRILRLVCKRTLLRKIHEKEGAPREKAMAVIAYSTAICFVPGREKASEKNAQVMRYFRDPFCKQCGLVPFPACFFVIMAEEPWLKSC